MCRLVSTYTSTWPDYPRPTSTHSIDLGSDSDKEVDAAIIANDNSDQDNNNIQTIIWKGMYNMSGPDGLMYVVLADSLSCLKEISSNNC
jgi:hypothetical protein